MRAEPLATELVIKKCVITLIFSHFSAQPYSNGQVLLQRQGLSNLYCESVTFESGKFHPDLEVHVAVSVDVQKSTNSEIYNAVAAYTTDVRPQGFTVCAMVAGKILRRCFNKRENVLERFLFLQCDPEKAYVFKRDL